MEPSFRIVIQEGQEIVENFTTSNPIEAETFYFKNCTRRTKGAGAIIIYSQLPEVVPPAYFRLDVNWPRPEHREQEHLRYSQIWANPPDEFLSPTPIQIHGALNVCGWSQAQLARQLDVKTRIVRYWLASTGKKIDIGYCEWHTFLHKAGFLGEISL